MIKIVDVRRVEEGGWRALAKRRNGKKRESNGRRRDVTEERIKRIKRGRKEKEIKEKLERKQIVKYWEEIKKENGETLQR